MEVYSSEGLSGSPELKSLSALLEDWKRQGPRKGLEFADFEQQVRSAVMALERRTIREGLQHLDVAVDEIKVGDEVLCRAYDKPFGNRSAHCEWPVCVQARGGRLAGA